MTLFLLMMMEVGVVMGSHAGEAIEGGLASVFKAHPCRFLSPTRCFAHNFDFQDTSKSLAWGVSGIGRTENADLSHAKQRMWEIREQRVTLTEADVGEVWNCSSTGTAALIEPETPIQNNDVHVSFDFMLLDGSARNVAVGFVFRYLSASDYHRFEWQPDAKCVSIVHYTGGVGKVKLTTNVLAALQDKEIVPNQYYNVVLEMVGGLITANVRTVNRDGHKVLSGDKFSMTAPSVNEIGPFVGGFYGAGRVRAVFDNVLIVAVTDVGRLGSFTDESFPAEFGACSTLSTSQCLYYSFDETRKLRDLDVTAMLDGPEPERVEDYTRWEVLRSDDRDRGRTGTRNLIESSGYGVTVESALDACEKQYGTYLVLNEARQIEARELLISFLMKANSHLVGGIGVMFNLQERVPGFRPTPSYYRYSMGVAPTTQEPCESLQMHNGVHGRFEPVMSERMPEAPKTGSWVRIEVHLSQDEVVVTRDGALVGQIFKKPGTSSLPLSYGDVALYCGGHPGGQSNGCEFDDVMVINKDFIKEAVVWDKDKHPLESLSVERPVSTVPIYTLGLLAGTRWEGVRKWTTAYTHDGDPKCSKGKKGAFYEQKMAIEFYQDGRFAVVAPVVVLTPNSGGRVDDDDEDLFLFSESRLAWVSDNYDDQAHVPSLTYRHPGSPREHCVTFEVDKHEPTRARMTWNADDDEKCKKDREPECGFVVELTQMDGDLSVHFPPELVITDPLPGTSERWVAGSDMRVTLHVRRAYNLKAQVFVRLNYGDTETQINKFIDFDRTVTDQWLTGKVRMHSTIHVDDSFTLGNNTLTFELKHIETAASVSTNVRVECKVCQAALDGTPVSQCAFTCQDEQGCEEERCNFGKIRCRGHFMGWNIDGFCTRYGRDRPNVCLKNGGCASLDMYDLCDYDKQQTKIVYEGRCAATQCRRSCGKGEKIDRDLTNPTLDTVCVTNGNTAGCTAPERCTVGGNCWDLKFHKDDILAHMNEPVKPMTAPPAPDPEDFEPVEEQVTGVCHQCINKFGEPGSDKWCLCCRWNCNGAREHCVSDGFCSSRCVDDSSHGFCEWMGAPERPPHVFEEASMLHDPDLSSSSFETDSTSSGSSTSSKSSKSSKSKSGTDSSSVSAGSSPESSSSDSSDSFPSPTKTRLVIKTKPTIPAQPDEHKDAPAVPSVRSDPIDASAPLPATGETAVVMLKAVEKASPMASLVMGTVLMCGLAVILVAYRRFNTQRPLDLNHDI